MSKVVRVVFKLLARIELKINSVRELPTNTSRLERMNHSGKLIIIGFPRSPLNKNDKRSRSWSKQTKDYANFPEAIRKCLPARHDSMSSSEVKRERIQILRNDSYRNDRNFDVFALLQTLEQQIEFMFDFILTISSRLVYLRHYKESRLRTSKKK